MKRRTERRGLSCVLLTGLLAFGFATTVAAEDRRAPAPLEDVIGEVDTDRSTITLGDRVFAVGEGVGLFDIGGRPVSLRELAVEGTGRMAEYHLSGRGAGGGELRRLQVMDGDFE